MVCLKEDSLDYVMENEMGLQMVKLKVTLKATQKENRREIRLVLVLDQLLG